MRAVIGLHSDKRQRQDTILRIQHGAKIPFVRILPFRNTSMKSFSRGVLLRHKVSDKSTNKVERITICDVQDIKKIRSIGSGSQTWRAIHQLQKRKDNEINPARNGPSTTTKANKLRLHDSRRYCQ